MSLFKKTVSLLAVFAVIPAAMAVTARPSVTNAANTAPRRLPTLTAYVNSVASTSASTSTSMTDTECVEAYTECMKGDDACGSEFEECTTRKLFHGKMPVCLNVLSQCSAAGINSLFGTSAIASLGNIKTQDSVTKEILDYTYPTDGSMMGQWVSAAAINNQYDTSTCVKRYTSCLNKDSVCGADFELCTTAKEFRKQALFCDSTLARCQSDGVKELLGVYPWTPSSATIGGRVSAMIEDGAQLAAMNAVSTCYKVVEQCFLGACTANPFRCIEGSTLERVTAANMASESAEVTAVQTSASSVDTLSKSDVNRYLKTSCLDTIGANKYCHMTFREKTPTKGELSDIDAQEEVFEAAIDQRKKYVDSKIQDIMQKFDTRAKDKCSDTIRTCAMRTCGEGIGSVCYTSVFNGTDESINKESTREQIKRGCESIVNTDTNCQYAYASVKNEAYSYSYLNNSVFDTLFPEYDDTTKADPIGVVASLNASLSNNYSMAAIAQMKKQCQAIATSCVKTMCGTDYVNCYRNRTDIIGNLTNSGDADFDRSMNKVGGVLDYTIVLGLCMNTVKSADVCDEHLKIEQARLAQGANLANNWGDASSVRDGWVDAGGAKTVTVDTEQVQRVDANGNDICTNSKGYEGICYEMDADGDIYDEPVYESYKSYLTTQAANTLFKELITDIEYEAQAKYNAKLTKQQNMCMSSNAGGVMGKNDLGSTFMWAKLKNNKVPTSYATAGLKPNQIVASNELYGSFCRVRVNVQSDNKDIQDAINKGADWATAYFAAGDSFTCGSWISGKDLEKIAELVGKDARSDAQKSQVKNLEWWLAPIAAIGSGVGGAYLGAGIANGDVFGKLSGLNANRSSTETKARNQCNASYESFVKNVNDMTDECTNKTDFTVLNDSVNMVKAAQLLNVDKVLTNNLTVAITNMSKACKDLEEDKDLDIKNLKQDVLNQAKMLHSYCETSDVNNAQDIAKKTQTAAGITGAVTAVAGGALTFFATKAIKEANLDKAEQEAYDLFMNEIGEHIYCYIGGEEAGQYGDVITTSME
ncbi:MAG: hypothetical protein IKA08_04915 [Alphaproteobacteria bacterium]|nr:hypothetical protein [Alphaproteobacteria bacterium]